MRLVCIIIGIGSTVSAINLTVTVFNMRTPGMSMMKMPVFTWMAFITQVLLVFALPVITVALFLSDVRPPLRCQFLRRRQGRRSVPLGAPVLDLRAS